MSGRLRAITAWHYRCFSEGFRLELRPLTLLYGWNNAGKSAAVRLVGLLGESVREGAVEPLDLTGPVGQGASFRDLTWKGKADEEPPGLTLRLDWDGAAVGSAEYHLDYHTEWTRSYVRALDLWLGREPQPAVELKARWHQREDLYDARAAGSRVEQRDVRFAGLIPMVDDGPLADLARQLRELRGRVQWLQSRRTRPPRQVPAEARRRGTLSHDGGNACEILYADAELREEVGRWFLRKEIDRELRFEPDGSNQRVRLNPHGTPFAVDFVDTGAGMAQALPVLTAAAKGRREARSGHDAIVAVEEPEAQLHPNAQRALGDWLCEAAAQGTAPSLVLETHSRTLILAVQLCVARGDLDPARVGIYWLEQRENGSTSTRLVELDSHGRPNDAWPSVVFADDRELAAQLFDRQIVIDDRES